MTNDNEKLTSVKKTLLKKVNKACLINLKDNLDNCLDNVGKMLNCGFNMIICNPNDNDRQSFEYGLKIRQLTSFYNSLFFIKSRSDLARTIDSDGIILEKDDIEISYIKKFFGKDKLYGATISIEDTSEFDFILENINTTSYQIKEIL